MISFCKRKQFTIHYHFALQYSGFLTSIHRFLFSLEFLSSGLFVQYGISTHAGYLIPYICI